MIYLFVYGTLRPAPQQTKVHRVARRLADRAKHLGLARTRGRLFRLDGYPGLVEAVNSDEWVIGDLYELLDPETTLAELDRYEGRGPPDHLFERIRAEVILDAPAPGSFQAWLYRYLPSVEGCLRLTSGDWFFEES